MLANVPGSLSIPRCHRRTAPTTYYPGRQIFRPSWVRHRGPLSAVSVWSQVLEHGFPRQMRHSAYQGLPFACPFLTSCSFCPSMKCTMETKAQPGGVCLPVVQRSTTSDWQRRGISVFGLGKGSRNHGLAKRLEKASQDSGLQEWPGIPCRSAQIRAGRRMPGKCGPAV